jgi:hypothetical protein
MARRRNGGGQQAAAAGSSERSARQIDKAELQPQAGKPRDRQRVAPLATDPVIENRLQKGGSVV